jgi:hypothetical protein
MPSSHLLKGALAYAGKQTGSVQSLVFQFNPADLKRLQTFSEPANIVSESIRFELVFTAIEGMEQGQPDVLEHGIYPQLAALEELLLQQTQQQHKSWLHWLFPSKEDSFLALIYGERMIPVKIKRMNIKEVLHNHQLQPIHATVDIAFRVLTETDLRGNEAGLSALRAYKQYRQHKAELAESRA